MPLVKAADKSGWTSIVTYTVGGTVSSVAVGGILGLLGMAILPPTAVPGVIAITIVFAAISIGIELGWLHFHIPQATRQTNVLWAHRFSRPVAALLWGADLGTVVTTRAAFEGNLTVLALAFGARSPAFGVALLLAYWFARAVQVWSSTSLIAAPGQAVGFLRELFAEYRTLQRVHIAGLIWAIVALGNSLHAGF